MTHVKETDVMETDVVVVGGGVTGVAVLRDLALRGVRAVLVERFDLGTGTSGRWRPRPSGAAP